MSHFSEMRHIGFTAVSHGVTGWANIVLPISFVLLDLLLLYHIINKMR
jgi:hypothetical protein